MLQHRCGSALQSSLVLCEHRWSSSPAAALRPWDWNCVALVLRFLLAVQQCCRKVPISAQFQCNVLTVCSHSIDFSGRKRVQAEMKSLWFTVHLLERRGEAVCPSCTPAVPWPAVLQPWPAGLALCTPSQPASLHRLSPPRTSSVSYSHLRFRSLPCIP